MIRNAPLQLNKYLAISGITSRRKANELILKKRIQVNGQVVGKLGLIINPSVDKVLIDGKEVKNTQKLIYILLHKPKGVISTVSDEKNRQTVIDLVNLPERVYPVGRLDEDSSGLILLTNDGDLANKLIHPKFETPKTYEVVVSGQVRSDQLERLRSGIRLKEGRTASSEIEIIKQAERRTWLKITIHEGRNRQIKRMFGIVSLNVLGLKRVKMGSLNLGDLPYGKYRNLTEEEVEELKGKGKNSF